MPLGARASRPHPVPLAAAELQCDAAGSHPAGGNSIGRAEGEPWRRSRLIQVGEMAEAVPGLVRAGRPRSQEAVIPRPRHTKGTKVQKYFGAACRSRRSICLLVYLCLFVSIGGSSSLTIGRFSSNDPHGVAGAWLTSEAAVSLSAAEGWNGSCSRLGGSGGSSFHYLEFSLFCREGGGRGLQAGVADYPAAGYSPPHRISLRLTARLRREGRARSRAGGGTDTPSRE